MNVYNKINYFILLSVLLLVNVIKIDGKTTMYKDVIKKEVNDIFNNKDDDFNIDIIMNNHNYRNNDDDESETLNIDNMANDLTDLFISHHLKLQSSHNNNTKNRRKLLTQISPDEIANGELRGGTISEPTPTCRRSIARWLKDCVYGYDG